MNFAHMDYTYSLGVLSVWSKIIATHLPPLPPVILYAIDKGLLKSRLCQASKYAKTSLGDTVDIYRSGSPEQIAGWEALIKPAATMLGPSEHEVGVRIQRTVLALNTAGFRVQDVDAFRSDLADLLGYSVRQQLETEGYEHLQSEIRRLAVDIANLERCGVSTVARDSVPQPSTLPRWGRS